MTRLSLKYRMALADHLKEGDRGKPGRAAGLGRQAVRLGLETLDLARMHEGAMATIISPIRSAPRRAAMLKRAQDFFIEAIAPLERTHAAAAQGTRAGEKLRARLNARASELLISRRDLKRGIVRRKEAELALKRENQQNAGLLRKSLIIQQNLRAMARQVMAAHENERERLSRELKERVSQELLGINVRLLTLERTGSRNSEKLLLSIHATQRLVQRSIDLIRSIDPKARRA